MPQTGTATATSGVEFTQQNPLRVKVGWINNKWDIQPSTEMFPDNKQETYAKKMQDRLSYMQDGDPHKLKNTSWGPRAIKNGPDAPKFDSDPTHIPIVVRPGEFVRFECDYPFYVTAARDPKVTPEAASPDSPFLWQGSQQGAQQSGQGLFYVLARAQPREVDITTQRFYKCQGWLIKDGETIYIDPDVVGSTDSGT